MMGPPSSTTLLSSTLTFVCLLAVVVVGANAADSYLLPCWFDARCNCSSARLTCGSGTPDNSGQCSGEQVIECESLCIMDDFSGLYCDSKLSNLRWSGRGISSLSPTVFAKGLPDSVSLNDNLLTTWSPVGRLPFEHLDLRNNRIRSLPPESEISWPSVNLNLELAGNPGFKDISLCQQSTSHCIAKLCSHTNGDVGCWCDAGWGGAACELNLCPDPTKYGFPSCNITCTCVNADLCHPITGVCTCKAGWTGKDCDVPCQPGRYGPNCVSTCPCSNGGVCDRFTGAGCDCLAGWTGATCASACQPNNYGPNCNSACNCVSGVGTCDRFVGCVCLSGWSGPTCATPCLSGSWGANCTNACACSNRASCDRFTGACQCPAGWTGPSCDAVCSPNRYGTNCSQSCACENGGTCDRYVGCRCTAGWQGVSCNEPCISTSGKWGPNCALSCNCNGNPCDRFSGVCVSVNSTTTFIGGGSGGTSPAGAIVGSIVGVFFLLVIAGGVVYFLRRRTLFRQKAQALAELELIDTVMKRPELECLEISPQHVTFDVKLSEGEFGEVFRVHITLEGASRIAAAKTFKLPIGATTDEVRSARSAFLAEIDLMRVVPVHDNLIRLLGVCTVSEHSCFFVDFAEHGDLRQYVLKNKDSLTNNDVMAFCIDIAKGMLALHNVNIVHRDLALRNCMVFAGRREDRPEEAGWILSPLGHVTIKVSDFGMSRNMENDYYRLKSRSKLPIKWLAPEALEKNIYTSATDVWAFGVTMWEAFSRGIKPYPGLENSAVLAFLKHDKRMDAPTGCPDRMHFVMQTCWRKHPETRPDFRDLLGQLQRIMAALCNINAGPTSGDGGRVARALTGTSGAAGRSVADGTSAPTAIKLEYVTLLAEDV